MQLQLVSDTLTVLINHLGAELCSVRSQSGVEFMWQADKAVWPRHAPVLFPIVGKLKNNSYSFDSSTYNLGQHGFARDQVFEVVESSQSHAVFELRANDQTKANYPFDFVLRITYVLRGNTLTTQYSVTNPAEKPMYFSIGAHPGFNCPLKNNEHFEDYYLEFETDQLQRSTLNDGLRAGSQQGLQLTGNKLFLQSSLFNNDALVFENNQINRISLCSSKSQHKISLECPGWPYFGIWTKKGNSSFICLEPWFGVADADSASGQLAQKTGIIELAGGQRFDSAFGLSFS